MAATGAKLRTLVADNPAQTARVDRLVDSLNERVAISRMRVELYRTGHADQARGANSGAGKAAMDRARAAVGEIMASENTLLARRTAVVNRDELIGFIIAVAVSALAITGLAALMLLMAAANRRLQQEIAERKAAEAARRDSEARYRAIFANTADLLSVIDVSPSGEFHMAEVNPAYEQATGATNEMVRGVEIPLMAEAPEARRLVAHLQNVVAGGKPVFTRDRVNLASGRRVWESILVPVRNAAGRVERVVGSSRDVTERDQAEEQMRRSQRMEAVGHLTGGVAHDFNNLLQVIRGNLELIATAQVKDATVEQRIKNALHGADRAAQLTRQLLAFARRQPLEPKVVNLGRQITDMAEMLRRTLGEGVEVGTIIADGLWNTLADPAQVESAVLNLALNARDAMPEGGRLTIEITNAVLDESYARREARAGTRPVRAAGRGPGHWARHVGRDRGPGVRALLHHQKRGKGHRPWLVDGLWLRQAIARPRADLFRSRSEGTTVKNLPGPRSHRAASLVEQPSGEFPGWPQRGDPGGRGRP